MHGQWSLLLVDLVGVGAVVAALAYGISFGGIFAKWSDLTISDSRLALVFQSVVSLLKRFMAVGGPQPISTSRISGMLLAQHA